MIFHHLEMQNIYQICEVGESNLPCRDYELEWSYFPERQEPALEPRNPFCRGVQMTCIVGESLGNQDIDADLVNVAIRIGITIQYL